MTRKNIYKKLLEKQIQSCEVSDGIDKHTSDFVHLPKSYFWGIVGILGAVVFIALSFYIWNLDFKGAIADIAKIIQTDAHNELELIKLIIICATGIIAEAIIALCTNRIKKFSEGLLWGLLSGLLSGLLFGLLSGLLFGLLSGLLFGLLSGLLSGLLFGLLSGLLFGLLSGLLSGLLDGEGS